MYAVGIDVSKGKSTVAVLQSKSEVLFFLIYHCKDVQGFVDSCNPIFEKYFFNPDTPCD